MDEVYIDGYLPSVNDLEVVAEIAEAELTHLHKLRNAFAAQQRASAAGKPRQVDITDNAEEYASVTLREEDGRVHVQLVIAGVRSWYVVLGR
jgi:hypothetical protein